MSGQRFSIYLKGKPVMLEPATHYADRSMAEDMISLKEREYPRLAGQLEVREVQDAGPSDGRYLEHVEGEK